MAFPCACTGPVGPTGPATPEIQITAGMMWASLTNGFSSIQQIESPTNKINTIVANYLQSLQRFGEVAMPLPPFYDGGTFTAQLYWMAANASANSVVWGIQARIYADGDAFDQAYGTAVEVTDANNANEDVNITAVTAAFTPAGSPAASRWVQFRIYRLGSGADNLAATAQLLGARVIYTPLP